MKLTGSGHTSLFSLKNIWKYNVQLLYDWKKKVEQKYEKFDRSLAESIFKVRLKMFSIIAGRCLNN